jgi:DNA-binding FrmR family transcriptional regulator
VNVTAITVDEKKLEQILTQINAMTRASQNLIYAVLTMYQEESRKHSAGKSTASVTTAPEA